MKTFLCWNRPLGRFFYGLAIIGLSSTLAHAAGPLTTVSDVVYRADGTPARGTVVITWPAFSTPDNRAIAAGSLSVPIGSGGQLNVGLVPNSGGTPAGTYYKVVYKLDDGSTSEEYWSVPSASTTTISAIRSKIVPSSVAMQVVSRQYVDSSLAGKADNAAVVHSSGDEIISGTKQFAQSPQVPSPAGGNSAAPKAYVDSVMSARGVTSFNGRTGAVTAQAGDYGFGQLSGLPASYPPSSHTHSAADLASGVLSANRVVAGTITGTRCLQTSSDGTQINETTGGCGGTSGNATQIQGRNVCADVPSDGNAVTWDAASSCYKPKPSGSSNADMVDGVHATGFAQVTSDTPALGQVPTYESASGKYKPQSKTFVDARDYATWSSFFSALTVPSVGTLGATIDCGAWCNPNWLTGSYNGSNANNVPILAYDIFGTGSSGTYKPSPTSGWSVRKRNLSEWGLCGNNPTNDTAVLNQALAAMGYYSTQTGQATHSNGNQTLIIDGSHFDAYCAFDNPTWPTGDSKNLWLTIEVNGRMRVNPSSTLTVPANVALVGVNEKNSDAPAAFQSKPNSFIDCQTGGTRTTPCIQFTSGTNYLANLNINGPVLFGGGINGANGGARARIENVAFSCGSSVDASCVPLTLDGFQWVWADDFYALQGLASPTTPAAIHLTNSGNYSQQTGNLHFNHAVVSGMPVLYDSSVTANLFANNEFNDFVFESLPSGAVSAFTFNLNNTVVTGAIDIRQATVADSSVGCVVNIISSAATSAGQIGSIHVEGNYNPMVWCANGGTNNNTGGQIYGAHWGNEFTTAGVQRSTIPTAIKHFIYENNGVVDAELKTQQGTYPVAVPYATLNVPQTASGWASGGGITVTAGKTDPWGGTNAASFSGGVNSNLTLYDDGARTLTAGDWYIYGACLRPDPTSGQAYDSHAPLALTDANNVAVFDDSPGAHSTFLYLIETSNMIGDGWECVAKATKVTTGGAAHLNMIVRANSTSYPFFMSMPWAMYIPQATASVLGDREIIRWARTLRAVPSNAVAGQVYMPGNIAISGTVANADTLDGRHSADFVNNCHVAADGSTDDTAALASCMLSGRHVRLPAGTIMVRPDVLNLADNLTLEGAGRGVTVLKVKSGAGSYATIIGPAAGSVNGASVRHLSIDQNETGNPAPSRTDIEAHPRLAIHVDGGDKLTIEDVEFRDVKSINTILSQASHTAITNSHFILNGSGSIYHDHSSIYVHADDVTIANNFFTGTVNGAGTVSAIETHSSSQVVTGNNINAYRVGMNITGISAAENKAITVTGNTLRNVMQGIEFYSHTYGTHTTGYGLDGALVANNAIYVAQNDWTTDSQSGAASVGNAFAIGVGDCDLPMRNISIRDNVVFYDLDVAGHTSTSSSAGILLTNAGVANCSMDNLDVSGNQITNAPASGIYIGINGSNFDISGNHITNPGSATDTNLNAGYRNGIDIGNPGAVAGTIRLANNHIVDNLATTRMVRGIYLASGVATSFDVRGDIVSVTGATTTAYLNPIEDAHSNTDTIYAEVIQGAPALTTGRLPAAKLVPGSRIVDASSGKWWSPISTGVMVEGAYSAPNSQFKLYGNPIMFSPNNTDRWMFTWDGQFVAYTDNANDIGTLSANRPRTVYAGTSVVAPVVKASGAGSGIVVKSPDGNTCKTIGIDNAGAITATTATCP